MRVDVPAKPARLSLYDVVPEVAASFSAGAASATEKPRMEWQRRLSCRRNGKVTQRRVGMAYSRHRFEHGG